MNPLAVFTRSGRKVIDVLPHGVQPRAWQALEVSHLALFRVSGRRLGTGFGELRFLFLHHFGAKSGVERITPLAYLKDGDRLVVIASKGGDRRNPAWFHNLKAHPDVRVELRGGVRNVNARIAAGEERARLWKKAAQLWPDYERYQARVPDRQIPVVVLEPRG
jgi:deazaflavin-dependent oxidoreductase (nitroreductase family)